MSGKTVEEPKTIGDLKKAFGLDPNTGVSFKVGASQTIGFNDTEIGRKDDGANLNPVLIEVVINRASEKPDISQKPEKGNPVISLSVVGEDGKLQPIFREEKNGAVTVNAAYEQARAQEAPAEVSSAKEQIGKDHEPASASVSESVPAPEPVIEFEIEPEVAFESAHDRQVEGTLEASSRQTEIDSQGNLDRFSVALDSIRSDVSDRVANSAIARIQNSIANGKLKDKAVEVAIKTPGAAIKAAEFAAKGVSKAGLFSRIIGAKMEQIGRKVEAGAEIAKSKTIDAKNWVDLKAQAFQNKSVAKDAIAKFEEGAKRTEKGQYSVGNLEITKSSDDKGAMYTVVDTKKGSVVIQAKTDGSGKITEVSGKVEEYVSTKAELRNEPKADLLTESKYENDTRAIAQAARDEIKGTKQQAHPNEELILRGKSFDYKVAGADKDFALTITKRGEGVVLTQSGTTGEVKSSMSAEDVSKFSAKVQTKETEKVAAGVER